MDSFEFNVVKAEKAQAMRNYNRQKMLKNLELFTALAFLAWSSYNYIPAAAAAKLSADFLRHNVGAFFGHPLYVFIAINILIAVISILSSTQKPTKQDLYDDYVDTITNAPRWSSTSSDDHKPAPELPVSDKQIICMDNVVNSPTVVKNSGPVCPVRESTVGTVTEVKEYRRTRSERLDRGKGNIRELIRRSETLIKRTTTEVKIDDLSSEEFRMTIETFIAAKKKTLIKENTLDLKLHKKQHSVALTLSKN